MPVMVAQASNELALIFSQTWQLVEGLIAHDCALPVMNSNHISIVGQSGTADETLAPDMLEFIATARL